jgi:hypothetical protein
MSKDPRQDLVDILRELNPSAKLDTLHAHAESLYLASIFGAIGDLPRARNAGSKKAKRELERAAEKAAQLVKDLSALPGDALRALEEGETLSEWHPLRLVDTLRAFAKAAQLAGASMPPTPLYRGNRHRVQPRQVARTACKIYRLLSGERGGRIHDPYGDKKVYGPLHEFVSAVFRALSITASADAQLKAILCPPRLLRKK